jgi:hypothetical protein
MASPAITRRREKLARLAALVARAGLNVRRGPPEPASCGCAALDAALPAGALARGSVVEWLGTGPGCGATILALATACQAQRGGGAVVVIDRDHGFYPPAAAAWGLDLAGLILVHPQSEADERWALDQALRCEHAAAVVAWPRRLDGRTFRRLQLAAESSGAMGLLVRPATARREPSWSHVRWLVTPQPSGGPPADERWRLAVRLLRVRGSAVGPGVNDESVELVIEIDPVTGAIDEARIGPLAAPLAGAARDAGPA